MTTPDQLPVTEAGILRRLRTKAIQPYPYIHRNPDGPAAADEIERLHTLAKANNLLARRHADEIERLRESARQLSADLEAAKRCLRLAEERMRCFARGDIGIVHGACPKYGAQEIRQTLARLSHDK